MRSVAARPGGRHRALARRLLSDHHVLVAPGELFGAPGHIRLAFGADAAPIATGFERLRAGLSARG